MAKIHPTAIVQDGAKLGADVEIGPYCLVGQDVTLGDGVRLQSHVVVEGVTELGESWQKVRLSLTSGAPLAFRYDLHTPRDVDRADLTETGVRRQARAAVGESTFEEQPANER